MNFLFGPLAEATGASLDQVKLIACLLVSYPLGSVFIRIPNDRPDKKHLFNIAVTSFYMIPMLGLYGGFLQLLLSVLVTYLIAGYIRTSYMPWMVFLVTMGHLTTNHILRAIYDLSYDTFEITGPQMVLTMKLTTFAWNVHDGKKPAEDLDKWQKEKRVVEYPSFLTFLGYAFYFPGFLVGPYLEFADYMKLVDGSMFDALDKDDDKKRQAASIPGRLVPRGRKRVAYRKMIIGLVFLGLYVLYGGKYNLGIVVEDWFADMNIIQRIAICQICGFFERTKYYAIWTLTEGASILTGNGFTGYGPSGETKWEGAANVRIWDIEFMPNFKVLLDSWNMKTNVWLRECIYKRVTPKGKKPGFRSSMFTFATSAFWHGVAVGYYLTFITGGFIQTAGRLSRSFIRPLFLPATYVATRGAPPPPQTFLKRIYDLAGTAVSILILNYAVVPFIVLSWDDSILGWSRLSWYGHVMIGASLVFFYGGGTKILKTVQKSRVQQAGMAAEETKAYETSESISGTATPNIQTLPPLDDVVQEMEKTEFIRNLHE